MIRHLNTSFCWSFYLYNQASEMTKVSYLAAAFKLCEKFSLLKIPVAKHAKERVHMQQRASIILTGNWEKGTGWMNVFLITLQRIDRISYMSPKASGATNYHDKLSTIFLIIKVFRQIVVHIDGKMPEAAVDVYRQAYCPTSV